MIVSAYWTTSIITEMLKRKAEQTVDPAGPSEICMNESLLEIEGDFLTRKGESTVKIDDK